MPYGGKNPAAKGRGGDTELGHLTPGEVILPPDFREQRPDLFAEIAEFLGNDIGRRTVGGSDDSINPDTGYPEFFPFGGPGQAFGGIGSGGGATGNGSAGAGISNPFSVANVANAFSGLASVSPTTHSGLFGGTTDDPASHATDVADKAKALSQVPDKMDFYNNGVFDVKGMKDAIAGLGLSPGEVSQSNIGESFTPSIFGDFQGLTDPVTGEVVSLAQLQAMTPAQFSSFSANPATGVVGDPESPFGKAITALGEFGNLAFDPTFSGLLNSLASSALFGSKTLGYEGVIGDTGEGFLGELGGWLSGLDAGDISTFGPSTGTGQPSNMGPGLTPPPQEGQPSTSQLFEQLQASILSPEQREAATTAALNRLSAQTGQNPFTLPGGGLDELQFADVISRGLARQNEQLVDPVSLRRFSSVFDDENLLKNILTEETGMRREGFTSDLESAFPGDAFGEIDDNIINSIIEERIGPAREQVSNFAARNLSVPGGRTANQFLADQETAARERLGEISGNVQSQNQLGVDAIRDTARSGISDFQLGDRFDVAPFAEQRQSLIDERTGSFGENVRTQLGSEPLFDVSGALSAGSRAGGLVSGPQQERQGLLDVIAERELAGRTSRRGLQRSGSGAF